MCTKKLKLIHVHVVLKDATCTSVAALILIKPLWLLVCLLCVFVYAHARHMNFHVHCTCVNVYMYTVHLYTCTIVNVPTVCSPSHEPCVYIYRMKLYYPRRKMIYRINRRCTSNCKTE